MAECQTCEVFDNLKMDIHAIEDYLKSNFLILYEQETIVWPGYDKLLTISGLCLAFKHKLTIFKPDNDNCKYLYGYCQSAIYGAIPEQTFYVSLNVNR